MDSINSALSFEADLIEASALKVNSNSKKCYQGQTPGHEGFLLDVSEFNVLKKKKVCLDVLFPYLIGEELIGKFKSEPSRYSINLSHCDNLTEAMKYGNVFKRIKERVLPEMATKAEKEYNESHKRTGPRQLHYKRWWKFWRGRPELISKLNCISRYIACARVTKRPIFEFVSTQIRPGDALQVFVLEDDYSFGILQSSIHWKWFVGRCSTLKDDFRYTSNSIFNSFPWPQAPKMRDIRKVAKAALELREVRNKVMTSNSWCLRELYRTLELPGKNILRDAHEALDIAVREVYGMKKKDDILEFLLSLNLQLAKEEKEGRRITGPGLPEFTGDPSEFVSKDCVKV